MIDGKHILGWMLCALTASAAWAQPLPEVQVTRSFIADFEFDWGRDGVYCPTCNGGAGNARFAFTDANNILWVANIDPDTGAFVPLNGHGVQADTDAAQAADFGNGPEWINTAQGSQLTYVKYKPGSTHNAANAGLAVAKMVGGVWTGGFIEGGSQRYLPFGSLDLGDSSPRLLYQGSSNLKTYYRYLNDPASETLLPDDRLLCSRRWVPGQQMLVFVAPCSVRSDSTKPTQVYLYDLRTGVERQITSDPTVKSQAWMWRAPEFDNDYALATVSDRTNVVIYRQLTASDGTTSWAFVNSMPAPAATPIVTSPETFVHNGKSYIAMLLSSSMSADDQTVPTQIAITGIDPDVPSFRMLTNDSTPARLRADPEYYITSRGPYIYYNRYTTATSTTKAKLEGVWRVDTGLGPPVHAVQ